MESLPGAESPPRWDRVKEVQPADFSLPCNWLVVEWVRYLLYENKLFWKLPILGLNVRFPNMFKDLTIHL